MATLEKVTNMKKQGISESEIIRRLREENISPGEISDALAQSQIKQAVSSENEEADMQPSMLETPQPEGVENIPAPGEQGEIYQPQMPAQGSPMSQGNYPQQDYAPQERTEQEYYPQESYQDNTYAESSVDNMIEIAEQVFLDKIKKMQKQFNELIGFKTIYETKIENISERLKRIEKMFDQMQISIINKVGSYGKGLDNLKKEIEMVEDSFSKVVAKKVHKKSSAKKTHSRKKK